MSVTEQGKEGAERARAERVADEWARVEKWESARRLLVDLRRQVGPKSRSERGCRAHMHCC